MKVLHITTNYPTPEYPIFGIFVKEQVESLQKLGVECDVLYCDRKNRGTWMYITYIPKIWKAVLTGKYDIIHCHHVLSALLLTCTLWPCFKKCVVSYQNDPSTEWKANVFGFIHLLFNKIIIKNKSGYLKYSKTEYLPNGCNEGFFYPRDKGRCRQILGWEENAVYVIYMDSNKGFRTQKRKDRFDATLEILRREYGYANINGIVMRNVERNLVPLYLNAADLHLISSDFEGSPNSVKECMCCNTPVVSTDVGNVREMIGDIPGAYVVDDFSPEALATACDKVIRSEVEFNGRDMFLAKGYSMSAVAEKLLGIYHSV